MARGSTINIQTARVAVAGAGRDVVARVLGKMPQFVHDALVTGLDRGERILRDYAIENVTGRVLRQRTGRLRASIDTFLAIFPDRGILRITTDVFYGIAWETGFLRPAYSVYPVTKQVLRFKPKGSDRFVFSRFAHIPAQYFPPKPWMYPAAQRAAPRIAGIIADEIAKSFAALPNVNVDLKFKL